MWKKKRHGYVPTCGMGTGIVVDISYCRLHLTIRNSVNLDIQHSQSFIWKYVKTKEPPYTEPYVRWLAYHKLIQCTLWCLEGANLTITLLKKRLGALEQKWKMFMGLYRDIFLLQVFLKLSSVDISVLRACLKSSTRFGSKCFECLYFIRKLVSNR